MRSPDRTNRAPVELASHPKHRTNAPRSIVARLEGLIDPPHAFLPADPRNFWNLLANDPRNLFQICCLLDDSATIIKWGAMENSVPTTERSTVASSVSSAKWSRDSVQNVLYAARRHGFSHLSP
jgi:hypothetical protein